MEAYGLIKHTLNDGTIMLIAKKDDIPKPTIIFITGSNFNPYIVNGGFSGFPFLYYNYLDKFNFIIASKPGIPLSSDSSINQTINTTFTQGYYYNNEGNVPQEFIEKNNCHFYVKQHLSIVKYLKRQKWCLKNNIILFGHSQGSRIAAETAIRSKKIKKLILSGPSIYNRFYNYIRKIRFDEQQGNIGTQTAQNKIDSINLRCLDLVKYKDNNELMYDGTTYYSTYSFIFPNKVDIFLKLKQQTLFLYGTASRQDLDCDYFNIELAKIQKTNIKVKPYLNYDHNYFENIFNEKGELVEQKFHWDDVMKDVMEWISQK
ncbi:MAG: hypothetical protein QM530_08385 [Phycisphaerales bacterium]|nr:hypothetical protein [Phycisphaerales bacterium]